ncbi:MAG: hypothetical protein ACR2MO_08335 [Acidimicrobiales bacterium]
MAAVVVGACGGRDGGDAGRASTGATTTTTTIATTAGPQASTTPAPPAASSTTAPGRTPTTTGATTTTTAARAAPAAGLTFTTPGTYRYTSTGRFMTSLTGTQERNGEALLTVDPPSGTDQRSVRTGFGRTTEQVLRLAGGDALLVSLRLVDQGLDKEVRLSPPGLALPGDAAPGRSWSWRAVSTDGKTTVDSAFKVLRTEDVAVGAERVPALVVEVTLTLTGDVTSTSKQTLWVSTARRLVVRQDDTTSGVFGLITFSGTSSDVLVTLTPG